MAKDRRATRRVSLGAQLVIGQDDDLIEWYRNLPEGTGNQMIKRLLRQALNLSEPTVGVAPEQVALEEVYTELEQLREEMYQLVRELPDQSSGVVDEDYLQELVAWFQQEQTKLYGAINRMERRIGELSILGSQPMKDAEDGEGLSEEEIKRRQKRMTKNQWG